MSSCPRMSAMTSMGIPLARSRMAQLWPFLGWEVRGACFDLRVCVARRCVRRGSGFAGDRSVFPVEAGDEFTVDLASGGELFAAVSEFLVRLGQGVGELLDSGVDGFGRCIAEVGEYFVAEDLAEAAA